MPGFTTHYLLGRQVFKQLPKSDIKQMIANNKEVFSLGLQGPDMFFYYLPSLVSKKQVNLGTMMHEQRVSSFFHHYMEEVERLSKPQEREIAITYFAGFLCHYLLDSTAHPYIYFKSGFQTMDQAGKDHYTSHRLLETTLDVVMLREFLDLSPRHFHPEDRIKLTLKEQIILSKVLSKSIQATFFQESKNYLVSSKFVRRNMNVMRFECSYLYHKKERSIRFIHRLENYLIGYPLLSSMLPSILLNNSNDSLNLTHKIWRSPWEPNVLHNESFLDMFEDTVSNGINVLLLLNKVIKTLDLSEDSSTETALLLKKAKKNLFSILGNYSYHSGLVVEN